MMITVVQLARWCATLNWWMSVIWLSIVFSLLVWVLRTPYILARVMSW